MSKHLKKGCPLPISIIAKQRRSFFVQAREIFRDIRYDEDLKPSFIREIVTRRTILYMDKFRNQKTLEPFLRGEKE